MITDNTNTLMKAATRDRLYEDFKQSVVVVSLLANLFVFVTWLSVTIG